MRRLGVVGLDTERQDELERIGVPLDVEVVRIRHLGEVRNSAYPARVCGPS